MQTINFRCGHCGQLLAVSAQYLGMQVRCPHCQQVVVAPREQPAAAPAPVPSVPSPAMQQQTMDMTFPFPPAPPPEEPESIFTAPAGSEDLFGQGSADAKVELPAETVDPPPAPLPNLELTSPASLPTGDGTLAYSPGGNGAGNQAGDLTIPNAPYPFSAPAPAADPAPAAEPLPWMRGPSPGIQGEQETDAATAAMLARPRSRSGWHIVLFIVPLISYSVLATIVAGIFWFRLQSQQVQPHPLEYLPDIDGEHPATKPAAPKRQVTRELPKHLIVSVGDSVDLGELRVEAAKVTRGPVEIKEGRNGQPGKMNGQALKLWLQFKNLSSDMPFHPMDRFFTRYWIAGGEEKRDGLNRWAPSNLEPFTYLEVGKTRFYGGPAGFRPPKMREAKDAEDEFIVGQDFDQKLDPGDSMETFVCTDPENEKLQKAYKNHEGDFLWRVQVRRGTVMVKGRRIPSTAVIGVRFSKDDVKEEKVQQAHPPRSVLLLRENQESPRTT